MSVYDLGDYDEYDDEEEPDEAARVAALEAALGAVVVALGEEGVLLEALEALPPEEYAAVAEALGW